MGNKPRLLVISAVMPFPLSRGQQVRVYNKLVALRPHFHITFLGTVHDQALAKARAELAGLVDEVILLPRLTTASPASRLKHRLQGAVFIASTGLRYSNYAIGRVDLGPERIAAACEPSDFDLVLYEYWHTHRATALFRPYQIPNVLDMHDLLWRTYDRLLANHLPPWRRLFHQRQVTAYKRREEAAWNEYDALITINSQEREYVRQRLPDQPIIHAPMGLDLSCWPYRYAPERPLRVGFYGAMANVGNILAARRLRFDIMPRIWELAPETELWIVGSNPPPNIQELAADQRVTVTGYVDDVAAVLSRMALLICPWDGPFGFRSRLAEAMALGLPVVATADAVHGMDLETGQGLLLAESDPDLAGHALSLLQNEPLRHEQSLLAHQQVQEKFSFEATYGAMAAELRSLVRKR